MSKELEKALELLRDVIDLSASDNEDDAFETLCRKYLSEESASYCVLEDTILGQARAFLASQQAEQHPEQSEGAQRKPNGNWSRFDPTFVIEYLRHDTNFDADLIGQMLEFAINSAALAQPSPSSTVVVDRGALKMVINALRRDAEEGRAVRGEMADALEGGAQPSQKCPVCNDSGIMGHSDLCVACDANAQPSPAPELVNALRQYQHNDGSGFVFGYDKAETERIVGALRERNEWLEQVAVEAVETERHALGQRDAVKAELEGHLDQAREREQDYYRMQAGRDAALASFKNFHRQLCERFGYTHDEKDWHRDQVSLSEHIAKQAAQAGQVLEVIRAEDMHEAGYYWWLPACFMNEPENPMHWSVMSWHPSNDSRQKSGLFVGPLVAPVAAHQRAKGVDHE